MRLGPRRIVSSGAIRALVRLGLIKIYDLGRKGRITQVVVFVEPMIRKKILRWKWFPPVLIIVESVVTPNTALRQYFSKRVVWVDREIACGLKSIFSDLAIRKVREPGVARALKRRGTPWDLSPGRKIGDSWEVETNNVLKDMGVETDKPIALVAMRDATYYERLRMSRPENEIGYETNPDTFIRNPDILTYRAALERLVELGLQPIHFGKDVTPIPVELKHLIVDYSSNFRLDRRDLLLARRCLVMVTGGSGAWVLPSMFNRPVLHTNCYYNFLSGPSRRDRFIPQLLWSEVESRYLSFREMVGFGGTYSYKQNCERDGVYPVKNTSEDLTTAVGEMFSRIHGTFVEDKSDQQMQDEFEKLIILTKPYTPHSAPIATTFLRKYSYLLS